MLHELNEIIENAREAQKRGLKSAFVSVVALNGSSYRRPGVRMLVREDGKMVGAVSGGCVEKEVLKQAQSVFADGRPKLMMYDGRVRLGCEGILYILIEPFMPEEGFFEAFYEQKKLRTPFSIDSYFSKEETHRFSGGSQFNFSNQTSFKVSLFSEVDELEVFTQKVLEAFRLIIVGSEHDAVQLTKFAAAAGWEVTLVAPPDDPKSVSNFPGASTYLGIDEKAFGQLSFDPQTAVVLMAHSFVKDLKYLSALRDKKLTYIALLGPAKRRERLLNELLDKYGDLSDVFLEAIHGPAGINIGAETAQEIAISIMAEILSVFRNEKPVSLKDKSGSIH
ncbi:XdhC family protein [Aureisphaera galaxeae]|nr:XdhC/CoxI family protein [Aureisphaera galaxeae]MDC8006169.1 XdhC family protein [Aureisphaera galaxeae]